MTAVLGSVWTSTRCAIHDRGMGRIELVLTEEGFGFGRVPGGQRNTSQARRGQAGPTLTGRHPSVGLGTDTVGVVHLYCRLCPGHPRHEQIRLDDFVNLVVDEIGDDPHEWPNSVVLHL